MLTISKSLLEVLRNKDTVRCTPLGPKNVYRARGIPVFLVQFCSVLAISYLGAKHDFEIWAFKVFFLWTRKTPLRMASRCTDLNIKIGKNTQEIHHKA